MSSDELQDELLDELPNNAMTKWSIARRVLALLALVGVAIAAYLSFGDELTLERLAERETQLRRLQQSHAVLVFVAAFCIYVGVAGLSLPGATVLTLSYAWFFGFWRAFLLVSFASTAGATVAFLLSRHLFRAFMERQFGEHLDAFNDALEREGAFYLFTLRLIPLVPFFVINAVMGLTRLRTATFWWVSQVGMLPGTAAYVYAGASVPDLESLSKDGFSAVSPQMFIAFALLGILPLALKRAVTAYRKRRT